MVAHYKVESRHHPQPLGKPRTNLIDAYALLSVKSFGILPVVFSILYEDA